MKIKIFSIISLLTILFITFILIENSEGNQVDVVEAENVKDLVNDYSIGNINNQVASITSHQLIVTDSEDSQTTYALPEEEFFVSIAPYVNGTHP